MTGALEMIWGAGLHSLCSQKFGNNDFRTDGFFDDIDELLDAAAKLTASGRDVWFGVHPLKARPEKGRGAVDDIASVSVLVADLDWDHPTHATTGLPTEQETRDRLKAMVLQPRVRLNSGHGLQTYLPLEEPVTPAEGAALQEALDAMLREHGLENDRGDLASILRVPGSVNFKGDPVEVVVEHHNPRKISLEAIRRVLGDHQHKKSGSSSKSGTTDRGIENVLAKLRDAGRDQDADALDVLCRHHGGHHPYMKGDEVGVTRPDKPAGLSASIGYVGPGIVKMFTPNWDGFDEHGRYIVNATGDALVLADDDTYAPGTTPSTTTATENKASTTTVVSTDDADELVAGNEVFAGPDGIRYSDTGNAKRFLDQYGANVRFVPRWGRWLVFDGGRWRIDYGDTLVSHLAGRLVVDLLHHAADVRRDEKKLKALFRHVKRAESAQGIAATLKVAASVPGVAIDHEVLDANPWLLNVANGTLDLSKGTLRDHDPGDHLTMQAAVQFEADAVADKYLIFLEQVLPDPDVRGFVQRLAGLALVGQQLEHVLPINLGNGANGKSTLTRIMADVLGEYAVVASRDVLLAMKHDTHPTAKADLFRRRFAHSGELPPGARLDEAQVKELTGGDRIKARRMREDHWEFDPSHLLWIHANHRPSIEGTDDGIWRRVLLIPFDVQVPEADRDSRLAEKIVKNESAGVLNWMIDGLADYIENGLRVPEIVKVATKSYRNESDTVAAFLDESDLVIDPNLAITSGDLLAIHGDWYQSAGIGESEKAHYQRVVDDLKSHDVVLKRPGRQKIRTWFGVGERGVDRR